MSYKRIVKKGAKTYGPYIYKSYRDSDGKVKKIYIGKAIEDHTKKKILVPLFAFLAVVLLFAGIVSVTTISNNASFVEHIKESLFTSGGLVTGFFSGVFSGSLSGHAILNTSQIYFDGKTFSGYLEMTLKSGELIPADSKIVVQQEGYENEVVLSDVVQMNANGNFYADGKNISGSGEGYGVLGNKTVYPEVRFVMTLSDATTSDNETNEPVVSIPSENVSSGSGNDSVGNESSEGGSSGGAGGSEPAVVMDNSSSSGVSESVVIPAVETSSEVVLEVSTAEQISSDIVASDVVASDVGESAGITGSFIALQDNEIEGIVSRDKPFEYNLPDGKTASIVSGSIEVLNYTGDVGFLFLDFNVVGNKIIVRTNFSYPEQGYGKDYSSGDGKVLKIDLNKLSVVPVNGTINVKLMYGVDLLAEVTKTVLNIGSASLINQTNESLVGNLSEVNVSEANTSLKQYGAVIGRPVKWIKKIQVDETNRDNLQIEIPRDAENITVKTGNEIVQAESDVKNSGKNLDKVDRGEIVSGIFTGQVSLDIKQEEGVITKFIKWLESFSLTGNVVGGSVGEVVFESELQSQGSITETLTEKIVDLTDVATETLTSESSNSTEIALEYYTPAPVANEILLQEGVGKRVVVSAADELNYTNILAYTLLDDVSNARVSMKDTSSLKLYWYASHDDAVRYGYLVENVSENVSVINNEINSTNETPVVSGLMTGNVIINAEGNVISDVTSSSESESSNSLSSSTLEEQVEVLLDVNETPILPGVQIGINYTAYDLNEDGFVDYIEWVVPHLSYQAYNIVISTTGYTAGSVIKTGNYYRLATSTSAPYNSLVGYWSFDADAVNTKLTTSYDFSPLGNNGTGWGDALSNSSGCIYGNCLQLDGNGDSINITSSLASAQLNTSAGTTWTLSAWIKPRDITQGGNQDILGNYMTSGNAGGVRIRLYQGYALLYVYNSTGGILNGNSGIYTASGAGAGFSNNVWQHIVGVYNGTRALIYWNGTLWMTSAAASSGWGDISDSGYGWYIGQSVNGYANASIDEVMVFNTSLTAAQISAIYNNASARFVSSGTLNVTQTSVAGQYYDSVSVGSVFLNNLSSNISLSLGYYNNSWGYTAAQNLTSGGNVFTIGAFATNLSQNFVLQAGPNSTSSFYTPLLNDSTLVLNTSYNLCYQETANASTVGNGVCALNYSGVYSLPAGTWYRGNNTYDGNWGSYGYGNSVAASSDYMYVNYSKPVGALNTSLWLVGDTNNLGTLTRTSLAINTSCWSYDSNKLVLRVESQASMPPCLNNETLISTPFGEYKITDLKVGDEIYSYNNLTGEKETDKIVGVSSRDISSAENKYYYIYYYGTSEPIKATYNHKFYVGGNFVEAKDLRVGDELLDINNTLREITDIEIVENYVDTVWDLSVERNHNFYANDILVHNIPEGLGVEWACYTGSVWNRLRYDAFQQNGGSVSYVYEEAMLWNVTADNTAPVLSIIAPLNGSNYNTTSVVFNVSSNETLSWCGLSIDSGANVTMTLNSTLTGANYTNSTMTQASHNFTIFCNDTWNNLKAISGINVLVDTTFPTITVVSPLNNTLYSSILFNVTSSETAAGTGMIVPNLDNSLVSWWRMDDLNSSGDVVDYFGRNNGTKFGGAAQTSAGKFGKAFGFDGISGTFLYFGTSAGNTGVNNFSISGWIKMPVLPSTSKGIVGKWGTGSYYYVRINGGNTLSGIINIAGTNIETVSNSALNTYWNHFVYVVNRAGSATLYINGTLQTDSDSLGVNISGDITNTNTFAIGRIGNNLAGWDFNGSIDEIMLFNKTLTADEVLALYNATRISHTETLSEGAHSYNAYAQDYAGNVVNSGVNNFTVDTTFPSAAFDSSSTSGNVSQTWAFMNLTTSDNRGDHFAFVNDGSLVSWWRMDSVSSTTVFDYMGSNNATFRNGPSQIDNGKFGKGVMLNGLNGYLENSVTTSLKYQGTSGLTLSVWINPDATETDVGYIMSKTWNGGGEYNYWLRYLGGRTIAFTITGNGSAGQTATIISTKTVSNGSWHHVVATVNNITNVMGVYIDGVLNVSGSHTITNWAPVAADGNKPLAIGTLYPYGSGWAGTSAFSFNGSIDEVMVFNRTLSSVEILALYNASANKYTNNFTNLTNGVTYSYTGYAVDLAGNVNATAVRTVVIDTTAPNITNTITINQSGVSAGTVVRGQNLTINATVTGITNGTGTVFVKIWQGAIGISTIIWQGFLNWITGNLWSVVVPTNYTFPIGTVNYTIYANDTVGNTINMSGNFTTLQGANLTECGVLGDANTVYTLQNDVSSTGTCFNVTANNVTLDGYGYNITYGTGGGAGANGIVTSGYNNLTVKNILIYQSSTAAPVSEGIELTNSNNSLIYNNTISTLGPGSHGVFLTSSSSANISLNNISNGYSRGILITTSSNNNDVSYNTFTVNGNGGSSTNGHGIQVVSSVNNTLRSNTITGNNDYDAGIFLDTNSNSSTLISNIIVAKGYGVQLDGSSSNNLTGGRINSTARERIFLSSTSINNIFSDVSLVGNASYNDSALTGSTSINNTFLNVSYNNESVASGSQLIRKWYYQAYVNDSFGSAVANANLTALNRTQNYNFNLTTNASGWTGVGQIIDYVNTGGTKSYYSLYNLSTANSSYATNYTSYNVTASTNNLVHNIQLDASQLVSCGTLNQANTNYTLANDINFSGNTNEICFTVSAANLTLNMAGHIINQTNTTASSTVGTGLYTATAIQINGSNFKVYNGTLLNFARGIYIARSGAIIDGMNITSRINSTLTSIRGIIYDGVFEGTNNTQIINNYMSLGCDYVIPSNSPDVHGISNLGSGTGYNWNVSSNIFENFKGCGSQVSNGINAVNAVSLTNASFMHNTVRDFKFNVYNISGVGLRCSGCHNSRFINNSVTNNYYAGVTIGGQNNTIDGLTIINITYQYPLYALTSPSYAMVNNTYSNIYIDVNNRPMSPSGVTPQKAIFIQCSASVVFDNVTFTNVTIVNEANFSVYMNRTGGSGLMGVVFINSTYNTSMEYIGTNSSLTRKWYYNAHVNDSNGASVVANVSAMNGSTTQFSVMSDASGDIAQQILTDYVNNAGTYTYYSNYTVNATNSSYMSLSNQINLTSSTNTNDVFTFSLPNITETITINQTGTTAGTVTRGQNVTINATVTGITNGTGTVFARIWQGAIGISTVIWQGFLNWITGNLWSVVVPTNYTFPIGTVNYTIYANDTVGNTINMSGNFTTLRGTDLTECGNLDVANTYYILRNNVSSTGTCFNVTANNVTIDGDGYNITYATSGTADTYGVYTGGYNNLTLKNAFVYEGNSSGDNKFAVYLIGSNYSLIYNNTILTNSSTAIGLYAYTGTNWLNITGNNFTCSNGAAISESTAATVIGNNTISYNSISSGGIVVIYFNGQHGSSIIGNNITSNYTSTGLTYVIGISLKHDNVLIAFNNITTKNATGIYEASSGGVGGNNTNITSNTITTNGSSASGIFLQSSISSPLTNAKITSNNITTYGSTSPGMYISTFKAVTTANISGNNVLTTGTSSYGIYLTGTTSAVTVNSSRNTITTKGTTAYGLFLTSAVVGASTFSNMIINSTQSERVYISSVGTNQNFVDSTLIGTTLNDTYVTNTNAVINMTNVSYSTEYIGTGTGLKLNRYWYYTAYANDTNGNIVTGANISAFNTTGVLQFTALTNSTGQIARQVLVDYVKNSTTTTYASNYTINATNSSYGHVPSNSINLTSSTNTNDVFTFSLPNITETITINQTGTTAGTVTRGQNVTINATVTGITNGTGTVFARIWQGAIGISTVIWQGFLNWITGNLWSVVVPTNYTFPVGTVNYTIYANDSVNNVMNMSGNFTMLQGTDLTQCGNLDVANTYYILRNDVSSTGTCFTVTANNVTLDGTGFNINYSQNDGGSAGYGVYVSGYNNLTIKNAQVLGSLSASTGSIAVFLISSNYSTIYNNTLYTNTSGSHGVRVDSSSNYVNITLNNISVRYARGITFTAAGGASLNGNVVSNTILTRETVVSEASDGIYFASGSNNTNVLYNNITTLGPGNQGIYVQSGGGNNLNITGNTITTSGSAAHGIQFDGSNDQTVEGNIITSGGDGLYLNALRNSTFTNNIIVSSGSGEGIYFAASSTFNIFNNNLINAIGASTYGVFMGQSSESNTFIGGTMNSTNNSVIYTYSPNNLFKDIILIGTSKNNTYLKSAATNNTFTNVSYSTEYVEAGGQLIRQWYYQAYVNDSLGANVVNANVTAFNVSGAYQFNLTTNASGWTSIGQITDYVNNGGVKSYYSLYNITAINSSYIPNSTSHTYNATLNQNKLDDVLTFSVDSTNPLIDYGVGTENTNEIVSTGSVYVNVSVTETNEANVTFRLKYSNGTAVNTTTFTDSTRIINWTGLSAGNYVYNVTATDNSNNRNSTSDRNIKVIGSCLNSTGNSCAENSTCNITQACLLNNGLCSGGVCDFTNFTINSTLYTLYNSNGNGNNLDLNISDRILFKTGNSIVFSGKNGTTIGAGSIGGNASVLNITTAAGKLFNTTSAMFRGIGGYSTLSGAVGGNGGMLQVNYWGMIGDSYNYQTQGPIYLSGGGPSGGNSGSVIFNRDNLTLVVVGGNSLRDVDIDDSGTVGEDDANVIVNNYNSVAGDQGYTVQRDINNDGMLNILDLFRIGMEYDRGLGVW